MQPITSPTTEKPHASTPTWPGTESKLLRTAEERPRSILANAAGGRPCPSQSVVIEIAPPDRTAERTLPPRQSRSGSAVRLSVGLLDRTTSISLLGHPAATVRSAREDTLNGPKTPHPKSTQLTSGSSDEFLPTIAPRLWTSLGSIWGRKGEK